MRGRLIKLQEELRKHSDAIKQLRASEDAARRHSRLSTSKHGHIKVGGWVWLIYGSAEQADYLRKRGHGSPWKHKYQVKAITNHAVELDVPTDGSVPRVLPWQSIRRVSPAPDIDVPLDTTYIPKITAEGLKMPDDETMAQPAIVAADGDILTDNQEEIYEVENVAYAEIVGKRIKIWIKYVGYPEPEWRWMHELLKETANKQFIAEINQAARDAQSRNPIHGPELPPETSLDNSQPTINLDLTNDNHLRRSERLKLLYVGIRTNPTPKLSSMFQTVANYLHDVTEAAQEFTDPDVRLYWPYQPFGWDDHEGVMK
jgi:hypothetical protein